MSGDSQWQQQVMVGVTVMNGVRGGRKGKGWKGKGSAYQPGGTTRSQSDSTCTARSSERPGVSSAAYDVTRAGKKPLVPLLLLLLVLLVVVVAVGGWGIGGGAARSTWPECCKRGRRCAGTTSAA